MSPTERLARRGSRRGRRPPRRHAWDNLADGSDLTFADWDADANRLARGLAERGLAPGERVVIGVGPDEPFPWLIAYTAVHRAGAVAVPVNTRLAGAELVAILDHAEPSVVLASATTDGGESWTDLVAEPRAPAAGHHRGETGTAGPCCTADADGPPHAALRRRRRRRGEDIMYTSGTTGSAKAVVVQHRARSGRPAGPSGTGWGS